MRWRGDASTTGAFSATLTPSRSAQILGEPLYNYASGTCACVGQSADNPATVDQIRHTITLKHTHTRCIFLLLNMKTHTI